MILCKDCKFWTEEERCTKITDGNTSVLARIELGLYPEDDSVLVTEENFGCVEAEQK